MCWHRCECGRRRPYCAALRMWRGDGVVASQMSEKAGEEEKKSRHCREDVEEKKERVGSRRVKKGSTSQHSEKRTLLRRRHPRVKMRLFICKLLTHTKQQPNLSREKEKPRSERTAGAKKAVGYRTESNDAGRQNRGNEKSRIVGKRRRFRIDQRTGRESLVTTATGLKTKKASSS